MINLQGKLNCKYVVAFYFSPKPQRANLKERWPADPEENLERLEDAGFPYDRQIPKCNNCGGKQEPSLLNVAALRNNANERQKWVTLLVVARKSVLWLSGSKSNVSTVTPVGIVLVTALSLVSTSLPVVTAGMSYYLSLFPRLDTDSNRSPEHKAADCPNPRSAEGVECKRCNESKFYV